MNAANSFFHSLHIYMYTIPVYTDIKNVQDNELKWSSLIRCN